MEHFFMMDGCTFLGFKISTPIHCHYKAWKSQDIFNMTLTVFVWKKKSYTPKMASGWAYHGVIFIFEWTIPLSPFNWTAEGKNREQISLIA